MKQSETTTVLVCPTHGKLGEVGSSIKQATAWCKQCSKWYNRDGKSVRG